MVEAMPVQALDFDARMPVQVSGRGLKAVHRPRKTFGRRNDCAAKSYTLALPPESSRGLRMYRLETQNLCGSLRA